MNKKMYPPFDSNGNVFSQDGEDQIIYDLLIKIDALSNGTCVEFGAHDGEHFSNTRCLTKYLNFNGILIESDNKRYFSLLEKFKDEKNIFAINKLVGFDRDRLDSILNELNDVPRDFDLLSIDVDGIDYYIFDSIEKYHPKIVIVEFNPTIPNFIHFIQERSMKIQQGSSPLSLVELGKKKGYILAQATKFNLVLVRADLAKRANIIERKLDDCRKFEPVCIYQGYDGTFFINRKFSMPWHKVEINQSNIQFVPKYLRNYPGDYNKLQKVLFYIWKRIKGKK